MKINHRNYYDSDNKKDIERIYLESFPVEEQIPIDILKECAKSKNNIFGEILDGDDIVGIEYLMEHQDIYYLMYYAIDEEKRSKGLGSIVLKELVDKYKTIILSIEKPTEKVDDIKNRRKQFYLRNGFFETNRYTEQNGVQYELLCSNKELEIDSNLLINLYSKLTEDPVLKQWLSDTFNLFDIEVKGERTK